MVWFRVDDGLPTSEWVMRITRRHRAPAIGLWTLAGAWCAKELTDGRVPEFMIEELAATTAIAQQLVDAGAWERIEDGYRFVRWSPEQPTREQVTASRKAEADRKRAGRERKSGKDTGGNPGGVPGGVPGMSHRDTDRTPGGVPHESHHASDHPSPVPVPDLKNKTSSVRPVLDRESEQGRTEEAESGETIKAALVGLGITDPAKVTAAIAKASGRIPDATSVVRIVATILDRAQKPVRSPMGCVLASIANDWPEWQQLIDEAAA